MNRIKPNVLGRGGSLPPFYKKKIINTMGISLNPQIAALTYASYASTAPQNHSSSIQSSRGAYFVSPNCSNNIKQIGLG